MHIQKKKGVFNRDDGKLSPLRNCQWLYPCVLMMVETYTWAEELLVHMYMDMNKRISYGRTHSLKMYTLR